MIVQRRAIAHRRVWLPGVIGFADPQSKAQHERVATKPGDRLSGHRPEHFTAPQMSKGA